MRWRKSICAALLQSILAFTSLSLLFTSPLPVMAYEEGDGYAIYSNMKELADFFNTIKPGSAISSQNQTICTLQSDVAISDEVTKMPEMMIKGEENSHYILDLNGYSITTTETTFLELSDCPAFTFEIKDGRANGKIQSVNTSPNGYFLLYCLADESAQEGPTLKLSGGSFISNGPVLYAGETGHIILDGARVVSSAQDVKEPLNNPTVYVTEQGSLEFIDGLVDGGESAGICLNQQGSLNMRGGTLRGSNALFSMYNASDDVTATISGGSISTQDSSAITIASGTLEISGEAEITGTSALRGFGRFEQEEELPDFKGSGVDITINGGTLTGTQNTAFTYTVFSDYAGVQDGKAAIAGGNFIAPEGNEAITLENESTQSDSSILSISGAKASSKINPDYLAGVIYQVYNSQDSICPWQYDENLSTAMEYLSLAPFNTFSDLKNLEAPSFTLTLNANTPAEAGIAQGLFGQNQYIISSLNQGSSINLPGLALSGYAFKGWYDAPSNGSREAYLYTTPSDQSAVTLYGQWSPDPDTPVTIPASGKGIDETGSQTVANTSGKSSTTFYMNELGNRARSVTNNTAPSIATKVDLSILSVNENNSLQNPLELSLGQNMADGNGAEITIPGNQPLQNAPTISAFLPYTQAVDYLSLPLTPQTGSYSTVAMREINGSWIVDPTTLIKEGRLIVELFNAKTIQADETSSISIVNNVKTFQDVTSSLPQYAQNAIAFISSRELMSGVGDKENFDPYRTLTRAQFATILYRFMGGDLPDLSYPSDVPQGLWYSRAAAWAFSEGLMAQGSNFNAGQALSREEFCTILYRLQNNQASNTDVLDAYNDADQVSDWAREGVAWAVDNRIIGQGSNLDPLHSSNRVNSAAMFERYIEQVCKGSRA